MYNKDKMGAAIIECPKCGTKFWFHILKDGLKYMGAGNEELWLFLVSFYKKLNR